MPSLRTIFTIAVLLFGWYLIARFLFSLHPKTRRIASWPCLSQDEPGIEKLREEVEGVEKDLQKIECTLEDIERQLHDKTQAQHDAPVA